MISKIKNSIIRFHAIDNKKKTFWSKVIYITLYIIFILTLISILLVYLGVLPDAFNDTLCGWYTAVTRAQLGDACR